MAGEVADDPGLSATASSLPKQHSYESGTWFTDWETSDISIGVSMSSDVDGTLVEENFEAVGVVS